ncbi:MAG: hypothetical protein R2704_03720 [Microthrixaceae bacterium]
MHRCAASPSVVADRLWRLDGADLVIRSYDYMVTPTGIPGGRRADVRVIRKKDRVQPGGPSSSG